MPHDEATTRLLAEADDALAAGLARWIAHQRGGLVDARVGELSRPTAGYSAETVFVTLHCTDDRGDHVQQLVVRMAPSEAASFADYDLVPQWQAQHAAASVGVPVADPVLETDTSWIGAPFILMPRMDGHIIGELVHRDAWLRSMSPEGRRGVFDALLVALSTIHRAPPEQAPAVPRRDNAAELAFWERYLIWSRPGRPVHALVGALEWCREHRPATEPPASLLWGDVRFENMVFGDDGQVRAVLDWDMTTVGAAEHDLAWFTSLDFTMHRLFGKRSDGFPDRDETVTRFESLSGRPVQDLSWYETLAMVRSIAIMTRISVLRDAAGLPVMLPIDDNVLLDLLTERLT